MDAAVIERFQSSSPQKVVFVTVFYYETEFVYTKKHIGERMYSLLNVLTFLSQTYETFMKRA